MNGGPSQVDTFDPKPLLEKYHGKPTPSTNLRTERKTGAAMRSPFKFQKYGQSGLDVSELSAAFADDLRDPLDAGRRRTTSRRHADELRRRLRLRLSMGAWVTYGPAPRTSPASSLCPGGYPIVATQNWPLLPGRIGNLRRPAQTVRKLIENIRNASPPTPKASSSTSPGRLSEMHSKPARPPARGPHPVV